MNGFFRHGGPGEHTKGTEAMAPGAGFGEPRKTPRQPKPPRKGITTGPCGRNPALGGLSGARGISSPGDKLFVLRVSSSVTSVSGNRTNGFRHAGSGVHTRDTETRAPGGSCGSPWPSPLAAGAAFGQASDGSGRRNEEQVYQKVLKKIRPSKKGKFNPAVLRHFQSGADSKSRMSFTRPPNGWPESVSGSLRKSYPEDLNITWAFPPL